MFAAALFSAAALLAVYFFTDDVNSPLDNGGDNGINGRVTTSDNIVALEHNFNSSRDLDFAGMCRIHACTFYMA